MSEIARLEREKRRALNKNNLREVANLSNLLGQELQEIGDYEGALAQHKEEGALCEALKDTIGRAISHRRRGEVYCDMGVWEKALHHQHQHLLLAKEAESLVEEQRAYATIGRTHLQRADDCASNGQEEDKAKALTEAEKAFLRSLSTCERLKGAVDTVEHCQMRCRLYLNLGLVLDQRGNSDKACNFINQALELCASHSLHEDTQRCHSALGTILLKRSLYTQALQEGQKALALAVKLHNKALQCEGYSFLAQVHLHNSDFEAAKRCYYKAFKLKHPFSEDQERIKNNLKLTVSLCQAENALILLGESETEEKIKFNEKFGDSLANLALYSQALVYYERMLELSLKFGKEPSFLAPIYLSLARTYSDNKQYEEAKKYYMKEYDIKIKEDYGEACKTLLSIGDVKASLQESYASISHTYQQARELAVKANKPKLEAYVLNQHMSLKGIPESENEQLQEAFKKIIKENYLDSDIELSEEEEEEDDDVDLDLEYFSDSSNEAENLDKPRQSRQRKSFAIKRNEKGETPLHKACIAGNLKMVKKLLQQNHPVNLRDNCGWLPIHEAANHGYYEIVQVLAEAGAWISDRGGQQCDGITPIHDAAACGNLDIVRLLMNLGASITAKTNEGDTPLESLVNYRLRTQMSERDKEECLALEQDLKEKLKQAGHKIPKIPHVNPLKCTPTPKTSKSQTQQYAKRLSPSDKENSLSSKETSNSSRSMSYHTGRSLDRHIGESSRHSSPPPSVEPLSPAQEEEVADDNSEDFYNPLLEDLQNTTSATGTYLNAIGCVGSAARRVGMQNASNGSSVKKDKKTALLSQGDDVGDDWLDDDLGMFTKKRKRAEKFAFEYREPRKERKILSEHSSPAPLPTIPKRARQTKLTTILPKQPIKKSIPEENVVVAEDEPLNLNSDNLPMAERYRSTSDARVSDSCSNVESSATLSGPLRLKVRVQDRLLLVPVAGGGNNRTVAWLAEEVTRRYYQLSGLRPHLVLTTQDGAALDPNDPITLVLPSDQAELEGQVKGWDLPPLPDRYTAACQALTTRTMPALCSALHQTEVSTTLDLSCVGWLATTHLQPVLRAIQYQHSLRLLRLANCRLCDDGFNSLLEALSTLPSLEMLDLRSSSITSSSLFELTQAITSEKVKLRTLCSIDLSYNVLSEAKLINIHTLLSLPTLLNLSLKHCGITLIGVQQPSPSVVTSPLKTLALDYNTLCKENLSFLLSCVPGLSTLTLSGLRQKKEASSRQNSGIGAALSLVLGAGEECLLKHLDLSCCNLSDTDLEDISAYLYRCPHLSTVNLAHNAALTASSVSTFFTELTTNIALPLTALSLHGNEVVACTLKDQITSALRQKATTKHAITKFSVTAADPDSGIENFWKSHYKKASIKKIGKEVFLSCNDA
ncbi:Tonsoku-like protein [Portunus trituberculatus]|uniref:Tonsoku-like protein n=1 Tax=Portunus trituberculatus TaxID=210409 RepID=A0A5B7CY49_PORTR|nr:Tonsoku-like protein [Portunus trituberculatus]